MRRQSRHYSKCLVGKEEGGKSEGERERKKSEVNDRNGYSWGEKNILISCQALFLHFYNILIIFSCNVYMKRRERGVERNK